MTDVECFARDEVARERQLARLAEVKADRSALDVKSTLDELRRGAEGDVNLMPALIDCVASMCTVGEIVDTLRGVWGEYQEPKVF
jgi:methylmalonyl-CoA mutase N-terminal domain/subunit